MKTAAELLEAANDLLNDLHEYRTFGMTSAESMRFAPLLDACRNSIVQIRADLTTLAMRMMRIGGSK